MAADAIRALLAASNRSPERIRSDLPDFAASIRGAAESFERDVLSCFAEGGAGHRESGALIAMGWMVWAFCDLAPEPHLRGVYRLQFDLGSALAGGPLSRSLGGTVFHLRTGCPPQAARRFFEHAAARPATLLRTVVEAESVNDWLSGLLAFSPVNEAQFLVYSMLQDRAADTLQIDPWEALTGVDATERAYRLKEFDEYAAHSYANGLMSLEANGFAHYAADLKALAEKDGPRAAARKSSVDVIRLIVPPAYAVAARALFVLGHRKT
jgi:hypothetical protein